MNGLLKLHKDSPLVDLVPFKFILYATLLSDIIVYEEDGTKWAIFAREQSDLYDYFADWSDDDSKDEVCVSLNELSDDGLIFFDDDDRVYVGEFRGKRLFPFERQNSLYDKAKSLMEEAIESYAKSKSAKDRSRARYIREQVWKFGDDAENMSAGSFTDLHGYLYEIYTGGEVYTIRNKTEYYQTSNILKAYDRHTTFAIIVFGVLQYDKFFKKGIPTLTNVAVHKDDIFRNITKGDGSKDYMRETKEALSEKSDF